jgi:hypothetical protein
MTSELKLTARVIVLALSLTLLGMFVASGTPTVKAAGPYQSALSSVGVATAEAARKGCSNHSCDFVPPAFSCVNENLGTTCVFSGGCQTVACTH